MKIVNINNESIVNTKVTLSGINKRLLGKYCVINFLKILILKIQFSKKNLLLLDFKMIAMLWTVVTKGFPIKTVKKILTF